jgi:catechol 2,3-dioxygenase-like lactoylglutathione lyase family enzyme
MFDHIGLRVKDLDASVRFYTAALGPLGYEATSQDESSAAFGAKGAYTLWLYADAKLAHSLVHLAFTAGNRAAVDAFYREGLRRAGATTAHPARVPTTAPRTTPRSCSIPTGITSKPCA